MKNKLLCGDVFIGIWGLGYVGLTAAVAFAQQDIHVVGYDPDVDNVTQHLQHNKCHIPNLEQWMGVKISDVRQHLYTTSNVSDMIHLSNIIAHIVAVPTEKDGLPWLDAINDVLSILQKRAQLQFNRELVIIESTLVPGTAEKIEWNNLAIAPRRDFFHDKEKNLRMLPRVYAGRTPSASAMTKEILSIICDNLIEAGSLTEAELTKCVENSLLHVPAVYAQQLVRAYPGVNIRRVLQLCSTHWRIPLYYPSIGTGGYCIPTSSQYVIDGADNPDELSIAEEAIETDRLQPFRLTCKLMTLPGSVAVLGICYKGDLKVVKGSPAVKIVQLLAKHHHTVYVHDPYYIGQISQVFPDTHVIEVENFPQDLKDVKTVIVGAGHQVYKQVDIRELMDSAKLIIDNTGIWEQHRQKFKDAGIMYSVVGDGVFQF